MTEAEAVLVQAHDALADADRLLTVAECAQRVRMSPDFIRYEIKVGRLSAEQFARESGRTRYRITEHNFAEWKAVYWRPTASA